MATDFALASSQTLQHLQTEFEAIRTGRANPALVEDISVEAYGTHSPLQQLASVSVPEPRMLVIQPWDPATVKDIERAVTQSSLGITPVVDGKVIRLPFPAMTEERRRELVKLVKEKSETAKVRVRAAREDAMKDIKRQSADGEISEDEAIRQRTALQADVDAVTHQIEVFTNAKEQEVMTV